MTDTKRIVLLSPHFPVQLEYFAMGMAASGMCVLGIADVPHESLTPSLSRSLAEYYRVDNMEAYDSVYRAFAFFTHKYGRIHLVESFNEHWLSLESRLRDDFNVDTRTLGGFRSDQLEVRRRKSGMKDFFARANVGTPRWVVPRSREGVESFARRTGFPVFAKPDLGVGAQGTFAIRDEEELGRFWSQEAPLVEKGEYILEEFVDAPIVTFDGLSNGACHVVFHSSLEYVGYTPHQLSSGSAGPAATCVCCTPREVDPAIAEAGRRVVAAVGIRRRFFHIEFWKRNGEVLGMEINLRPPGSWIPDMWNYAFDIDLFALTPRVLLGPDDIRLEVFDRVGGKALYFVGFACRRDNVQYKLSIESLRRRLGSSLVVSGARQPPCIARPMGDLVFIFRAATRQALDDAVRLVTDRPSLQSPRQPRGSG